MCEMMTAGRLQQIGQFSREELCKCMCLSVNVAAANFMLLSVASLQDPSS